MNALFSSTRLGEEAGRSDSTRRIAKLRMSSNISNVAQGRHTLAGRSSEISGVQHLRWCVRWSRHICIEAQTQNSLLQTELWGQSEGRMMIDNTRCKSEEMTSFAGKSKSTILSHGDSQILLILFRSIPTEGGCWNLSGPNLRPETNPRRLTASCPSAPYLASSYLATYHRTIPELSYYADADLRTLGGPLITYGTHA